MNLSTPRSPENASDNEGGVNGRRSPLPSLLDDGGMLGESDAMRQLGMLLTRVADSDATVLICGESGSGKELVARSLHMRGKQAAGPFVAINCAAMPESLLESELFGHVRGAFTDASSDKRGLFEEASGGTLFLDELGEMPIGMQAKLLRALQERKIRPVGGKEERGVDVRLIAATNRDLEADVATGRFREDLFYRVNVVTVEVPPLRERGDDVLLLARAFISEIAGRSGRITSDFTDEVANALRAHDWPGNVRELQNCMERAVALASGRQVVQFDDLPEHVQRAVDRRTSLPPAARRRQDSLPTLAEVERRYIRHVLKRMEGNKTKAAEVLGIDRRTLHRKIKRMSERSMPATKLPSDDD